MSDCDKGLNGRRSRRVPLAYARAATAVFACLIISAMLLSKTAAAAPEEEVRRGDGTGVKARRGAEVVSSTSGGNGRQSPKAAVNGRSNESSPHWVATTVRRLLKKNMQIRSERVDGRRQSADVAALLAAMTVSNNTSRTADSSSSGEAHAESSVVSFEGSTASAVEPFALSANSLAALYAAMRVDLAAGDPHCAAPMAFGAALHPSAVWFEGHGAMARLRSLACPFEYLPYGAPIAAILHHHAAGRQRKKRRGIAFAGDSMMRQLFSHVIAALRGQAVSADTHYHDDALYIARPSGDTFAILTNGTLAARPRLRALVAQWFPNYRPRYRRDAAAMAEAVEVEVHRLKKNDIAADGNATSTAIGAARKDNKPQQEKQQNRAATATAIGKEKEEEGAGEDILFVLMLIQPRPMQKVRRKTAPPPSTVVRASQRRAAERHSPLVLHAGAGTGAEIVIGGLSAASLVSRPLQALQSTQRAIDTILLLPPSKLPTVLGPPSPPPVPRGGGYRSHGNSSNRRETVVDSAGVDDRGRDRTAGRAYSPPPPPPRHFILLTSPWDRRVNENDRREKNRHNVRWISGNRDYHAAVLEKSAMGGGDNDKNTKLGKGSNILSRLWATLFSPFRPSNPKNGENESELGENENEKDLWDNKSFVRICDGSGNSFFVPANASISTSGLRAPTATVAAQSPEKEEETSPHDEGSLLFPCNAKSPPNPVQRPRINMPPTLAIRHRHRRRENEIGTASALLGEKWVLDFSTFADVNVEFGSPIPKALDQHGYKCRLASSAAASGGETGAGAEDESGEQLALVENGIGCRDPMNEGLMQWLLQLLLRL